MRQRHRLGGVTCFVGLPAAEVIRPEHTDALAIESYCGTGSNVRLYEAGVLVIVPVHYGALPGLLTSRPARRRRRVRPGVRAGRGGEAQAWPGRRLLLRRPGHRASGDRRSRRPGPVHPGRAHAVGGGWTARIRSSRPPAELTTAPPSPVATAVAARVSELIEDGATLQFGIGALPEACLDALGGHRDLGVHSGLLNEAAMRLIQAGVVTGARKTLDRGLAVGGSCSGRLSCSASRTATRRCSCAARATPTTRPCWPRSGNSPRSTPRSRSTCPARSTPRSRGAATWDRSAAPANSCAARPAPPAASLIALPSTAGAASRIVVRLNGPVSTPRSNASMIVTELGAADLRGAPLPVR